MRISQCPFSFKLHSISNVGFVRLTEFVRIGESETFDGFFHSENVSICLALMKGQTKTEMIDGARNKCTLHRNGMEWNDENI